MSSVTYQKPDAYLLAFGIDVLADLETVIARHDRFRPVADFGVRIDVLLADSVRLHGAPAAAKVRVVKAEDRAMGAGDVRIIIDKYVYEEFPQPTREALIAHELYHLDVQTRRVIRANDAGEQVVVTESIRDDYDRPVIRLIPDDWMITGFRQVAEWYGPDSCERRSFARLRETLNQGSLPFAADDKPRKTAVGKLDADGNLHCAFCGCSDLGPVDGGDPLCNGCDAEVRYPQRAVTVTP